MLSWKRIICLLILLVGGFGMGFVNVSFAGLYNCTSCKTNASPPYFVGQAWYSVLQSEKVLYTKTFNSLADCQRAQSTDYYCTNLPPVGTDH